MCCLGRLLRTTVSPNTPGSSLRRHRNQVSIAPSGILVVGVFILWSGDDSNRQSGPVALPDSFRGLEDGHNLHLKPHLQLFPLVTHNRILLAPSLVALGHCAEVRGSS